MIAPAERRALAVIPALALGPEPRGLQASRHGVELDTEGGYRPVVDHVIGLDLDHDVLADRHDNFMIDGEEPRLAFLEVCVLHDDRIEMDALVRIVVGPVPLAAG